MIPAQAEWDFSQCPSERLYYCWAYEFARESPTLILHYREEQKLAKEHPDQWMFDADGNWHHTVHRWGRNPPFPRPIPVNELVIAPGFPEVPYLQTKHDPFRVSPSGRLWTTKEKLERLVSNGHQDDFKQLGRDEDELNQIPWLPKAHVVRVRWDYSNKELMKAFKLWLEKNRPFPAIQDGRGKSKLKKYETDLKALAAYRLMRTFKVPEAMDYMKKCGRNPLFQKECDWSTAKSRAANVLRQEFDTEPYFSDGLG